MRVTTCGHICTRLGLFLCLIMQKECKGNLSLFMLWNQPNNYEILFQNNNNKTFIYDSFYVIWPGPFQKDVLISLLKELI